MAARTDDEASSPLNMAKDGSADGAGRWLMVLWPLAVLFHLAGNGQYLLALQRELNLVATLQLAMIVVAGLMLVRPGPRAAGILAALFVLVLWLKMPVVGNHEIILGLFSLAVIPAVVAGGVAWPDVVAPTGRAILLVAYGFIAFSKLNSGFLDVVESCAVLFADEFGDVAGLRPSESSVASMVSIVSILVIEASIPILLIISRFRRFGVALALPFHFLLALEPSSHIWDFSATLLPLFLLFAPASILKALDLRFNAIDRRPVSERALFVALVLAVQAVVMSGGLPGAPTWSLVFPVWLAISGTVTAGYLWSLRHPMTGVSAEESRFVTTGPRWLTVSMLLIVGVAALNGVAPYLELRTAAAFNMYSNLRVIDGQSNHLIVGGIRSGEDSSYVSLVRVDEGSVLDFYVERNLSVPAESLARFLEAHPDEDPLILAAGQPTSARSIGYGAVEGAVDGDAGWSDRLRSTFSRKLAARRAVHTYGAGEAVNTAGGAVNMAGGEAGPAAETRCLRAWGPIG